MPVWEESALLSDASGLLPSFRVVGMSVFWMRASTEQTFCGEGGARLDIRVCKGAARPSRLPPGFLRLCGGRILCPECALWEEISPSAPFANRKLPPRKKLSSERTESWGKIDASSETEVERLSSMSSVRGVWLFQMAACELLGLIRYICVCQSWS